MGDWILKGRCLGHSRVGDIGHSRVGHCHLVVVTYLSVKGRSMARGVMVLPVDGESLCGR